MPTVYEEYRPQQDLEITQNTNVTPIEFRLNLPPGCRVNLNDSFVSFDMQLAGKVPPLRAGGANANFYAILQQTVDWSSPELKVMGGAAFIDRAQIMVAGQIRHNVTNLTIGNFLEKAFSHQPERSSLVGGWQRGVIRSGATEDVEIEGDARWVVRQDHAIVGNRAAAILEDVPPWGRQTFWVPLKDILPELAKAQLDLTPQLLDNEPAKLLLYPKWDWPLEPDVPKRPASIMGACIRGLEAGGGQVIIERVIVPWPCTGSLSDFPLYPSQYVRINPATIASRSLLSTAAANAPVKVVKIAGVRLIRKGATAAPAPIFDDAFCTSSSWANVDEDLSDANANANWVREGWPTVEHAAAMEAQGGTISNYWLVEFYNHADAGAGDNAGWRSTIKDTNADNRVGYRPNIVMMEPCHLYSSLRAADADLYPRFPPPSITLKTFRLNLALHFGLPPQPKGPVGTIMRQYQFTTMPPGCTEFSHMFQVPAGCVALASIVRAPGKSFLTRPSIHRDFVTTGVGPIKSYEWFAHNISLTGGPIGLVCDDATDSDVVNARTIQQWEKFCKAIDIDFHSLPTLAFLDYPTLDQCHLQRQHQIVENIAVHALRQIGRVEQQLQVRLIFNPRFRGEYARNEITELVTVFFVAGNVAGG